MKAKSNVLYLPLKRRWFEAFKYGEKEIEYREITPTWVRRFLILRWVGYNGEEFFEPIGKIRSEWYAAHVGIIKSELDSGHLIFREYKEVVLTDGYPRREDTERRLKYPIEKIDIGTANLKWVPEDTPFDKEFFRIHVIKEK